MAVYKQLYRAAKAKSKLRIKATSVTNSPSPSSKQDNHTELPSPAKYSYLDTVLSSPLPGTQFEASSSTATGLTSTLKTDFDNAAPADQPTQWLSADVGSIQSPRRDFKPSQADSNLPVPHKSLSDLFFIDCNKCGRSVDNEHYHCSICENGDYDLCLACVDAGITCQGDSHWLIKRFVKDGVVTNSTTETIAPRKTQSETDEGPVKPTPESIPEQTSEKIPESTVHEQPPAKADERICNACLKGKLLPNPFPFRDLILILHRS